MSGLTNLAKIERALAGTYNPVPRGRPSNYSPEIAASICIRLAQGLTIVDICRQPGMPGYSTVAKWIVAHADFRAEYARAREAQAEYFADQIVKIADSVNASDRGAVEKARLQVDARKWHASKTAPKKYGDRSSLEVSGELTLTDLIAASYARAGDGAIDVTPAAAVYSDGNSDDRKEVVGNTDGSLAGPDNAGDTSVPRTPIEAGSQRAGAPSLRASDDDAVAAALVGGGVVRKS